MENRRVDQFATELFTRTRRTEAKALGITGAHLDSWNVSPWEKTSPFLHKIFRARAIRMLDSDLSVLPSTREIGMVPR